MQDLKITFEELTSIYQAGDERGLSARLRRLTNHASPEWRDYWAGLHEALSPSSELRRWCENARRANYEVAHLLRARLVGKYGQPLAKAIVRRLAPHYRRLPRWKARVLRVLGGALNPSADADAADLLLRLHDTYDVDQKSRVLFLRALARAELPIVLPAFEHHLFVERATSSVDAALPLLDHYPGSEATEVIRRGILEAVLPGTSALYSARRRDSRALGSIERRIAESADLDERQRFHLKIAKHAIQEDERAMERIVRSKCRSLDLLTLVPLVEQLEPPRATRLLALILRHTQNSAAIEALARLGPPGQQVIRRAAKSLPPFLGPAVALALGEQRSPDAFLDEAMRIGTSDEDSTRARDLRFNSLGCGEFGPAHIPKLAGLLAHTHFAALAAAELDKLGTDAAIEHLTACARDPFSPGCESARGVIWRRGVSGRST